jgi:RNA polymerase sigma-70 factor (family 1)
MRLTLPEQSDVLLLEECKNDNTRAFEVLFERYSGKLYHYALKYVKNEAQAEEAMMDLMFWLWDRRHQLPPDIQLSAYLFRAIKNAVIKIMTRQQDRTIPLDLAGDPYADNADNHIYHAELQEVYDEKLQELSLQRQRVFRLSRHENMTHAEIAREMNLSLFTVKNHIKASLSYFRDHLKDYMVSLFLFISLLF